MKKLDKVKSAKLWIWILNNDHDSGVVGVAWYVYDKKLTGWNVILEILAPNAFQKYSKCWVF